jgi:hypothetical protein
VQCDGTGLAAFFGALQQFCFFSRLLSNQTKKFQKTTEKIKMIFPALTSSRVAVLQHRPF